MPSHPTVLAFSYIRFSSKKQEQGDSRRRQTDGRAAHYCERRGWTLSAQSYEDLGVSAFRGKNALVGNLGEFLKAVKSGRIPPGSVLIVESLDRITRQGIDEGYDLIKGLLKADIRIVTLSPEREFDRDATRSLSKGALEIQLILERAAEESERKSERVAAARQQERKRLRDTGEIVTLRLPAWIAERDGKPVLIPERIAAVKRIFGLAASGYGVPSIVAKLTRDGVPPMGRTGRWTRSYVGLLLRDRRVLGEYQPHRGGKKEGDPVRGYFPAVVTESEWLAARAGIKQRKKTPGRIGKSQVNVFAGLLRNAREGDTYFMTTRLSRSPTKETTAFHVLLNANADLGLSRSYSIPYDPFEQAVLSCLREIDPREVLEEVPREGPREVASIEVLLAGVESELAEATAFMEKHGFSPTIGHRVADLEAKRTELNVLLEEARHKDAHPLTETWDDAQNIMAAIETAADPADARLRLRAALRRITEVIMLLVVPSGHDRLCAAQFHFKEGRRRDFLIHYRPAAKPGGKPIPASLSVRSLADVAQPGSLDLRKPDHAKRLEKALAALPLDGEA
jgi:DNA invertase Pin-like site-specific DNA recombinase